MRGRDGLWREARAFHWVMLSYLLRSPTLHKLHLSRTFTAYKLLFALEIVQYTQAMLILAQHEFA